MSLTRRSALLGLAVALFGAYAWTVQINGWNQNAHFALVRALADGVPYIDRSRHEIGDLGTGDVGEFEGHVFATKPPGLALFTLPAFWVLDLAGGRTTGDPTRPVWWLHLWSAALPGALLVLLVGLVASRLEPGYGVGAAAILGLSTLVFPFSTMLFNHVLSTLLAFAAFALLWLERSRGPDLRLVAAAGVATGLGVAVDFQVGFAAAVLLLYALGRDRLRRGALYVASSLAGALPLWAYNVWAFGNPLHTSYEDYHQVELGDDLWAAYVRVPSLGALDDLFLSSMGLLVLMPVLVAGAVGLVLLARSGWRAEALTAAGIVAVVLVYHSGVGGFGGQGPPRYLTTLMPFLALGFAPMLRRFPLTTIALGGISAFQLVLQASTGALASYDGEWLDRVADRVFVETGAAVVGVTGWYAIVPLFLLVVAAVAFAVVGTPRLEIRVSELPVALGAVAAWGIFAAAADNPFGLPPSTGYVAAIVLVCAAAIVAAAATTRFPRRAVTA